MAYVLFGARSPAAAMRNPLALTAGWFRRLREARRRRLALMNLLGLEPARLDDLGLCRNDIIAALAVRTARPGAMLSERRRRRALGWRGP
jgi:hypothetical protein